jgi:hypothetical protein
LHTSHVPTNRRTNASFVGVEATPCSGFVQVARASRAASAGVLADAGPDGDETVAAGAAGVVVVAPLAADVTDGVVALLESCELAACIAPPTLMWRALVDPPCTSKTAASDVIATPAKKAFTCLAHSLAAGGG